jgi:hypothetical protein
MVLLLGPGGIAQAEVVEVEFDLTAALVLGTIEVAIEGVTLAGDWDDETGDFEGEVVIPEQVLEVETGLPDPLDVVEAAVTFEAGPVVGTVPPDGSEGEVTASVDVSIGIALLALTCSIPTFELALATNLIVDEEAETVDFVALDDAFSVGEADCGADGLGPTVTGLLNTEVGLPTDEAYLCLATDLELCGEIPTPPTPPTPPDPDPVPPTPEPVTPASATPAFTG